MLVDSKKEKLEPIDIIKTALAETKSQYNLQQGVAAIFCFNDLHGSLLLLLCIFKLSQTASSSRGGQRINKIFLLSQPFL